MKGKGKQKREEKIVQTFFDNKEKLVQLLVNVLERNVKRAKNNYWRV